MPLWSGNSSDRSTSVSNKTNREIRAEEEAIKARVEASRKKSNLNAILAIGAIVAAGLGLALWLTSGSGAPKSEAQAQKAGPKAEISEAELMKPGPLSENMLGNTNAKVTIVEYASMSCPACASFHATVYPELKKKYVETGKVRFVFREFPLDPRAGAASMLARCAGPDKFFQMIEVLFKRQEQWAFIKGSPIEELKSMARQTGMSEEAFNTCVNDKKTLEAMEVIRNRGSEQYGVASTPTFFINGKKLTGGQDLAAFDKLIEPLLK
jgi:protein-disulfide isomerase